MLYLMRKMYVNSFVYALKCVTDTDARLKTPTHCCIIRQVSDKVFPKDLCVMIRNSTKAEKIWQAHSHKFAFGNKDDSQGEMDSPVILCDYDRFCVMHFDTCRWCNSSAKIANMLLQTVIMLFVVFTVITQIQNINSATLH